MTGIRNQLGTLLVSMLLLIACGGAEESGPGQTTLPEKMGTTTLIPGRVILRSTTR